MGRREILAVAILVAAAALWLHHRAAVSGPPAAGTVVRVVDGDTVVVAAGGGSGFRVRLLGIDTPETVDPHRPAGCYGSEASAYTKHLLTGRRVRLVYDSQLQDVYGRWLAYVYLHRASRPDLFVNARLVSDGYARTLSIPPNTAHAAELAALERSAAVAGRGLWSSCN